MVQIKLVNKSSNPDPEYKTMGAAGFDLQANLNEPNAAVSVHLAPGQTRLFSTGLHMQIPLGYEGQIRSRSGLAAKHGVQVLNSPGTIDSDYRGDIGVILINHGKDPVVIRHGDRIAQMVIAKHEGATFQRVESLNETERGEGGFGHTGN